eukprot:14486133-Alexandrium_andersonii.AAC.1
MEWQDSNARVPSSSSSAIVGQCITWSVALPAAGYVQARVRCTQCGHRLSMPTTRCGQGLDNAGPA